MKLGVFDVIPRGSLDSLTAEDLRLLLNGMGDISTQALIGYTSFNDESSAYMSSTCYTFIWVSADQKLGWHGCAMGRASD